MTLTDAERVQLDALTRMGTASVRMDRRAQTLLLAAKERKDEDGMIASGGQWEGPGARALLSPVLDYVTTSERVATSWHGWEISQVLGGRNGLVYRISSEAGEFAVKLTVRHTSDRVGREYRALRALADAGLAVAPMPVLMERDRYRLPVLVQTWLAGDTPSGPLTDDEDWLALLRHLLTIHSVTPDAVRDPLQRASVTAHDVTESRQRIVEQLGHIPPEHQPGALHELMRRLDEIAWPSWPRQPMVLCRGDLNVTNFLRRPGSWVSVDWEYGGWGDSAFEVAKLLAHPSYHPLPAKRRHWVTSQYSTLCHDTSAAIRVDVYYRFMLVWWAIRFSRYLYEVPRGLHERLATRPADWEGRMKRLHEQYVQLALAELEDGTSVP